MNSVLGGVSLQRVAKEHRATGRILGAPGKIAMGNAGDTGRQAVSTVNEVIDPV